MSFDFDHAHKKRADIAKTLSGSYRVDNLEKSEAHQDTTIGTPFDNQSRIALNISQSYSNAPEISKAEEEDLEKGGKKAFIGETRTHGGREYIRTANGWKFHGKGTGKKAQQHKETAAGHTKEATSAAKTAPKAKTFEEVLADPEGKKPTADIKDLKAQYLEHREKAGQWIKDESGLLVKNDAKVRKESLAKMQETFQAIKKIDSSATAESLLSNESKSASGKHIKDMSATEKKTLADKLGVDVKGKTTKQVDKALSDAMVDKQMADFKAKKGGEKTASMSTKIQTISDGAPPKHLPKGEWSIENNFKVSPGGGWSIAFGKGYKLRSDGNGKIETQKPGESEWKARTPPISGEDTFSFTYANHPERRDMWNAFAKNLK